MTAPVFPGETLFLALLRFSGLFWAFLGFPELFLALLGSSGILPLLEYGAKNLTLPSGDDVSGDDLSEDDVSEDGLSEDRLSEDDLIPPGRNLKGLWILPG